MAYVRSQETVKGFGALGYSLIVVTFAVVGHNEAATLPRALAIAKASAESAGDRVWFVDSGSSDGSKEIGRSVGVEVLQAPVGKGRALRAAIERCETAYLCLLDADITQGSPALAGNLAAHVRCEPRDMVVGQFSDGPGVLSNTMGIYQPLVAALFPEAADRYGRQPLSGFRILKIGDDLLRAPDGFGVEAFFNVVMALRPNSDVGWTDVGHYQGRFLYKPWMGREIGGAVLDLAQSGGRLAAAARPAWDAWVEDVVSHVASYRGEPTRREAFRARLMDLARRPLPSRDQAP